MKKFFAFVGVKAKLLSILASLIIVGSLVYFTVNKNKQKTEGVLGEQQIVEQFPSPSPNLEPSPANQETQQTTTTPSTSTAIPSSLPTPTSIPIPPLQVSQTDFNKGKLQSIKNIFNEIGEKNIELNSALLFNSSINSSRGDYGVCREKYNDIFNPFTREDLIKSCQENSLSYLNYLIDTAPILSKISELSKQAYDTALTCEGSTCIDFYWGVVNGLEAKGMVAR